MGTFDYPFLKTLPVPAYILCQIEGIAASFARLAAIVMGKSRPQSIPVSALQGSRPC